MAPADLYKNIVGAKPTTTEILVLEANTIVSARPIALVIEEFPVAYMQLASQGYVTEVYHVRQNTTASTRQVIAQIRHGKFKLLWLGIPTSGRSCPPGRYATSMRELADWMRHAQSSACCAILIGLRGRAWQDESLKALLRDSIVYESKHHLCSFNMQVLDDQPAPSSVAYHCYTTWKADSSSCNCGNVEHRFDLG